MAQYPATHQSVLREASAMPIKKLRLWTFICVVLLVGCAQPAPVAPSGGTAPAPQAQAPAAASTSNRTLRIGIRSEPGSIAGTLLIPSGITTTTERRIFNASLVLLDGESKPRPYLAEA